MTLRHRLMLVYLIVVLLSVATVGMAVFELEHSRQIYGSLQLWNDLALAAAKLRSSYGVAANLAQDPQAQSTFADEWEDLLVSLVAAYPRLADAGAYRPVDEVRESLNALTQRARELRDHWPGPEPGLLPAVGEALTRYITLVEAELDKVKAEAVHQETRMVVLLMVVGALTVLHVAVIGSLLRRWLIQPMEQLNRQVAALARDEAPPEPLLASPQEMARLANALDDARRSLGSMRQQLLDAERMTTIGQLAAQLAHNLRNPLASIRASAQMSARRSDEDVVHRRRMADIIAAVDGMNRWIEGLMQVAQQQPRLPAEADVVPVLHRVREALATEATAKELTLTVSAPPAGIACPHDPVTLEQALVAMAVNAIEASPLGGVVELRVERVVLPVDDTSASKTAYCRLSVLDRGHGLPVEAPERIFDFSYSTKQRGMGLGLALARLALQRQGGQTHARNRPEGGAWVWIDLPM